MLRGLPFRDGVRTIPLWATVATLALCLIAPLPAWAQATDTIVHVSAKPPAGCDRIEAVCAVMPHDRLISFANECEARAAGSLHVLFGDCHDDD